MKNACSVVTGAMSTLSIQTQQKPRLARLQAVIAKSGVEMVANRINRVTCTGLTGKWSGKNIEVFIGKGRDSYVIHWEKVYKSLGLKDE